MMRRVDFSKQITYNKRKKGGFVLFFESDMLSLKLLDVVKLKQKDINTCNSGRHFNALSFRLQSDAVLKTEKKVVQMKENTILFVPAGINYSRVARFDELIVIHFEMSNCDARKIEFFESANSEEIKNLFLRILECWNQKEAGYRYTCSAFFYQILALCYSEKCKAKPQDSKIQKSTEYLLAHYKDIDVTIKKIAEKSFISEVYFRKLFKAEHGISPQKFIIRLRIQAAKELIATGYYSLQEIALMSGYTDYKYFSTEFKKQVGVSPSDYCYNYNK